MSGVERAGYMDNLASAAMAETIIKEKKLQRDYFKKQEESGRLVTKSPPAKTFGRTALDSVGVPLHVTQVMSEPVNGMTLATSKNMWTSNPGYIVRDGPRMCSTTHKDYVYDEEEVEFMRQQGHLNKTHNRRRDEFVMYVEAHAKQFNLMKGAASGN